MVSLIERLVACSAKTDTDKQSTVTACTLRVNKCLHILWNHKIYWVIHQFCMPCTPTDNNMQKYNYKALTSLSDPRHSTLDLFAKCWRKSVSRWPPLDLSPWILMPILASGCFISWHRWTANPAMSNGNSLHCWISYGNSRRKTKKW